MADLKKLLESLDDINHSSYKTTANLEAFVGDMVKAFGGEKNATLDITITLKGNNVLEYSINKRKIGE